MITVTVTLRDTNTVTAKTPYRLKELSKSFPGAKWDPRGKVWCYPVSVADSVIEGFQSAGEEVEVGEGVLEATGELQAKEDAYRALITGEKEPREDDTLMHHQRLARDIAEIYDRFAFFYDTGTGKTVTALSIIEENQHLKWLVIAPKAVIRDAWIGDMAAMFPELKLLPVSKNFKKKDYQAIAEDWGVKTPKRISTDKLRELLAEKAQGFIINPESFKKMVPWFEQREVNALIVDESAKLKDVKAQVTKITTKFADKMNKVYLLSGKPAPNNEMEYFSQMRVLDPGLFGKSFYKFREDYFYPTDYYKYNWEMAPDKRNKFIEKLQQRSIFKSKDDVLDLPPKTDNIREVELPGNASKYYREMERHRVLELQDRDIAAPNILASMGKLRQITSGFVLDTDHGGEASHLHSAKVDALMELLAEIGEHQVIIWVNFKQEVRVISDALEDAGKTWATAYSQTKNVDKSVEDFKSGEVQYLVAHPGTLKYGVTLTNCTYAVYFSLSYSYEDYYQSHDRIRRKGQEKPQTFYYLIVPGTIDEVIMAAIKGKDSLTKAIEGFVKDYK